ncbi:MAG: cysteine hydrolase family protein [Sarcina sp.]
MNKIAMLIIDVQNLLVDNKPFDIEIVLKNIKSLVNKCRKDSIEVIYVQHEDLEDDGELKTGSYEWEIHKSVEPKENETVISKNFNSSFRRTRLKEYLDKQGINTLIITGMQTECCIDTTIRVGFEYGFDIIIPEKTNTTFDRETITGKEIYEYHNFIIFKDRFAKVESLDVVLKLIEGVN